MTAEEGYQKGFINGIIDTFDTRSDWFNPDMIPAIPRLLSFNSQTLKNCMKVMNNSKNIDQIEKVTRFEAENLYQRWTEPGFMQNISNFMSKLKKKKNNIIGPRL